MFDENGFAIRDCRVTTYRYNHLRELSGSHINIEIKEGTGIPGNTTLVKPLFNDKEGFAEVFNIDKQKWELVEDHRGTIVYDIESKRQLEIDGLGKISAQYTTIEPPTELHEWNGSEWILSKENQAMLEEQERAEKINSLEAELNEVEKRLERFERIDDRSEEEEKEFQSLNDQSVKLFREIEGLKKEADK